MCDIPKPVAEQVIVGERIKVVPSPSTRTLSDLARSVTGSTPPGITRGRAAPEPGRVPAATTIDRDRILNK